MKYKVLLMQKSNHAFMKQVTLSLFIIAFCLSIATAEEISKYTDDDGVIHVGIKGETPPKRKSAQGAKPESNPNAYLISFYKDQIKNACNIGQSDLSRYDINQLDQFIKQSEQLVSEIKTSKLSENEKLENERDVLVCRKPVLLAKRNILVEGYNYNIQRAAEYYEQSRKAKKIAEDGRKSYKKLFGDR